MAAEIKVNRTKNRNKSGEQRITTQTGHSVQKQNATITSQIVKEKKKKEAGPKYDTRKLDGAILNANQKKTYNKQFEFFTKALGPGHYDPKLELTKPKS